MLLTQKCEFFSLFTIDRLEIMLGDFAEKKETFLTIKKQTFSKSKKSHISKGLTHAFAKKRQFILYLQLIKIRLEIMLSDFAEKKETFLSYKK